MKASLIIPTGLAVAASALAGDFKVDWFTVDGGGSTSAGGAYALDGTIAQPDAARSAGGKFKLEGGFWPAFSEFSVSTNTPRLRIVQAPVGIIVSWSANYPDYQLEATDSLPSTNWTAFPTPPQLNGAELQMVFPVYNADRYFRLRQVEGGNVIGPHDPD